MDAKQAGLILMFGLSYIDGGMDSNEIEKVAEYSASNFSSSDSDFKSVMDIMMGASNEKRLNYMLVAAAYIGANVDTNSKLNMLNFLIELAKADGKAHDNELALIVKLKEVWL